MLTSCIVITNVFPDEFHLHTLDLLLSAIARLNPHVDLKKIVIGLMDRLSSYAAREAESVDPERRKLDEEEAVTKLLRKLELSGETDKEQPPKGAEASAAVENGAAPATKETSESTEQPEEPATNGDSKTKTGIPEDVKLYDVFYEQVVNLIKTRALPIQDTMALLVSLVNLALYDSAPSFPSFRSGIG